MPDLRDPALRLGEREAVVQVLCEGGAGVSDLADPFWPRLWFALGLNALVVVGFVPGMTWDRAFVVALSCWAIAYGVIR